jgi:hypothetical protein
MRIGPEKSQRTCPFEVFAFGEANRNVSVQVGAEDNRSGVAHWLARRGAPHSLRGGRSGALGGSGRLVARNV